MTSVKFQSKHWKEKNKSQIQSYWDSPPARKRSEYFANFLTDYNFNSISEIGFFAGRNLKYIKELFPNIRIGGIDINKDAVKFAKEKLKIDDLCVLDIYDLETIDFNADIVFTSGVLIHLVPNTLDKVIEEMVKKSNRYVIHIEDIGNNEVVAGPKHLNPSYKVSDQKQWAPDLPSIYDKLGYKYNIFDLPPEVRTNGAKEIMVIEK